MTLYLSLAINYPLSLIVLLPLYIWHCKHLLHKFHCVLPILNNIRPFGPSCPRPCYFLLQRGRWQYLLIRVNRNQHISEEEIQGSFRYLQIDQGTLLDGHFGNYYY